MPFVLGPDGRPILQCINHQLINHEPAVVNGTTMQAENAFNGLPGVEPPVPPGQGRINLGRGLTVLCYWCTVCGYVELYDASVIAPETWPEH